jgi:type IV secretion system protein VirB5
MKTLKNLNTLKRIPASIAVGLLTVGAASFTPTASAQMAVVDVRAIGQLIQQIRMMQQQLETARGQLREAQATFQAMTGRRGMEQLLAGEVRNYLPPDWQQLASVIDATSTQYGALARELDQLIDRNAVLSDAELGALGARPRTAIDEDRRDIALTQALSRSALDAAGARFDSLRALIEAIPTATDAKAAMDLQARISAEQVMLANEHAKLAALFETAEAERLSRAQQRREQAIRDLGSLRSLPRMGL